MVKKLEREERNMINYLRTHYNVFQKLFDSNYGNGYFEHDVLENYEIRFRILQILLNEYELIRFLLSDVV